MKRRSLILAACMLLSAVFCQQVTAQNAKGGSDQPKLKVGDVAPDFKLQYFDGSDLKDVSLSQYRGKKNVVLAFYIFAFTGG
jgi:cytochrome oxidase Cu insertion factor (SCO1/SenC/PrrC family)